MIPVAILTTSAVATAAILLINSRGGPDPSAATTWETACQDERSGDFKCFEKHYQTIVNNQSVEAAFTDIKAAYDGLPYVKGNCHQLVHVIGRAAGNKYGDVTLAYERGDEFCWSGYYHGVMESIIAKVGYQNIKDQLNTICATISTEERYSFAHYNCAHGLGHGVMLVSQHELFDALKTCDTLGDGWERESCYGGVFMENIMSEINPDHTTKYLKSDDLLYPCTAVEPGYKQQCFLMQTSHALQVNGYDFGGVFALCDGVEAEYRPTCYQSLGRDISGNTVSDAERTRDLCMMGRDLDARSNCITGAVKDFIAYFNEKEAGRKLCAVLDPTLLDQCMAVAESFNVSS
jgi:hypothetical protein